MATRIILGDIVTGRRIQNLPVTEATWSRDLSTGTIQATVHLGNKIAQSLGLWNSAQVGKTFLAAVDTDAFGGKLVLAAGPIWNSHYERDAGTLQLTAKGMESMFDHRLILPAIARTYDITKWTIVDPTDPAGVRTIPNPALTTSFSNLSLGTIAKRLLDQAMAWTGGVLPIILPSEETDTDPTHVRTYLGADFKPIGEAIQQLSQVDGGPEIVFSPEFTSDGLGIQWRMLVGTNEDPLIHSNVVTRWNVTVPQSPVSGLTIDTDGTYMGSISWATGGRQDDDVLVSRAEDDTLINQGYPLMEVVDSSHTTVSIQSTLDGYAAGALKFLKTPTETWSFSVRTHPQDQRGQAAGPQQGDYGVGDFISLVFSKYDPTTGRGDPYFTQEGPVPLRIVGMSGDQNGLDVKITCAPLVGA